MSMRQPGVEVRPLKQITGSSRVLRSVHDERARREGQPDRPARRGLGDRPDHARLRARRPTRSARVTGYAVAFHQPGGGREAAHARRPAAHRRSRSCARSSGEMCAELEVSATPRCACSPRSRRASIPAPASSLTKLSYTEFEKRFMRGGQEILGPYGQLTAARPTSSRSRSTPPSASQGTWAYAFLWSRAGTIYSGSSEIQKNVIGERCSGCPRRPRADRAGGRAMDFAFSADQALLKNSARAFLDEHCKPAHVRAMMGRPARLRARRCGRRWPSSAGSASRCPRRTAAAGSAWWSSR